MNESPRKPWLIAAAAIIQVVGAAVMLRALYTESSLLQIIATPFLGGGTSWLFYLTYGDQFEQEFPFRRRRGPPHQG
ncbi:hypothetical protein [Anatilimnocola aggregata]|uniref:hypothetical protein n=1 Tax=Anatilimnocola aggregata TaxID=2528021 RepID=UPI0011A77465|nr:hypothetical protein [Anatilimnocola aggregata]